MPTAEDACGTVTITFVDVCTEQGLGGYTATRTFTIADDCGNSTEWYRDNAYVKQYRVTLVVVKKLLLNAYDYVLSDGWAVPVAAQQPS